jgi:hypothetical protein
LPLSSFSAVFDSVAQLSVLASGLIGGPDQKIPLILSVS